MGNNVVTVQECAQYYAENPDDEIGKLAGLIAKAKSYGEYRVWDYVQVGKVAEIIAELEQSLSKIDEHAEMKLELDPLLGKNIYIVLVSTRYEEWSVFQDGMDSVRKIINNVDEITITPLVKGKFQITLVVRDVRKLEYN